MVGDSQVDILTARNAGLWSVGVTYGFAPQSLNSSRSRRAGGQSGGIGSRADESRKNGGSRMSHGILTCAFSISPQDGFAALRHEPALLAAELTWRWCFGLSAWGLGIISDRAFSRQPEGRAG